MSGHATPPRPLPRHAPYMAPLRALREVARGSAHHSLMVQSNCTTLSCPLPSSASGPAAWFEAGPIPTHYSLEVRPRTRLALSACALGLQVMRPARNSESLSLKSLQSCLMVSRPAVSLFLPTSQLGRLLSSEALQFTPLPPPLPPPPPRLTPRPPTGRQLPAPPLPGDSPLRPDPVPLSNLAQGCRPGARTLAF